MFKKKQDSKIQKQSNDAAGKDFLLTKRRKSRSFFLETVLTSVKLLAFVLVLLAFGLAGLAYGVLKTYADTTPSMDISLLTKSDRTSYIYDAAGNEITSLSSMEYREWVDYEQIPDMLKNAFIAIEDVRFYKHNGVDVKRLVSAALEILGNSNSSGGSTITQQLIKNKILGTERTYKRKVQEAYLALELEKYVSKEDILEAYLNDIYLGGSDYGVLAAARDYFGKELSELSIRECAILAGITQSPYYYNPRQNMYYREADSYQRTRSRTDTVLDRMYKNGYITKEQYESAVKEQDTILKESRSSEMYDYAYFVEYAVSDVITYWLQASGVEDTSENRTLFENKLRTGGYRIYTTLDTDIQQTVQSTLSTFNGYPELEESDAYVMTEEISEAITIQTEEPQAAAVVMDQTTGNLLAIVGGRNEPQIRKGLNRASQSYTEVGSAIKPLAVYGPALDTGMSAASVIVNAEGEIEGWNSENGYPNGGLTSKKYYGFATLRTGLAQSLNVVAARTLMEHVGIETSLKYMERLGIPAKQLNRNGAGLALGTSGITPIQMCAAYAAIANNGYYLLPLSFTKMEDEQGNVILDASEIRGGAVRVYDRASTAYQLIELMKEAVESGTGKEARISGYEVAGKTGTNSNYSGVYFAGITCDYTSVVFIGHDQPVHKLKTDSTGGLYAATLWKAYMEKLMQGKASRSILTETAEGLGMVQRTVCPVSGKLATSACEHYRQQQGSKFSPVTEWFDYDTAPQEYCDMHATLTICSETNCRAGENCDIENTTETTKVLIRKDSDFYALTDTVLNKIFGDTYVRTDKSVDAFISDYPVCSESAGMGSIKTEVNALKRKAKSLLDTEWDNLGLEETEALEEALASAESASDNAELYEAYIRLEEAYAEARRSLGYID